MAIGLNSGRLEKMLVIAYGNERFENETGRYTVMVNPETYTYNYQIELDSTQGTGTSTANLRFNRAKPEELTFDFVFDGTGVIPGTLGKNVVDELETFKNLVIKYQGGNHQPYFVSLVWGALLFKGRVKALKIDFKLFNNEGIPLRAVANVTFQGSVEDNLRVARENAQSPDLTHWVEVNEKETLHLLAHRVYGNPAQYIRVAQANDVNHFRQLKTGQPLRFPPFKNEAKK
jgi:hypothetical protein